MREASSVNRPALSMMREASSVNRTVLMLAAVRFMEWLALPVVLLVYAVTMTPAVGLIDSGELAAGCYLLNVLHPTGYPLYTVIGRVACLVPLGTVFSRMAGLSALLGTLGIGLVVLLLRRIGVGSPAAGSTALVLGFSLPVWSVCVDVEVYALTLVLSALVWLAAERNGTRRYLLFFAYVAGLALTNHMSVVSVVVGASLVVLLEQGRELRRGFGRLLLLFVVGLTPYLLLLLRARAGPLLAWGNTVNLERLWWHVTGKQYQVWMFSLAFAEVVRNVGKGLALLGRSFAYVLLPVVAYGGWRLWRVRPKLTAGLAACALLSFLYAVNYSIPDIEAYYIPCVLALAVFCGVGLHGVALRLGRWRYAVWAAGLAVLAVNSTAANRSDHFVAHDGAVNALASAEENAIVLTDWWDVYSPVLYLQEVEGVRADVCMIDKELVRRSWYFGHLAKRHPWLIENSRAELERYLAHLDEFEHGRLRSPAGIQQAYIQLLESFVLNNPDRPAYATFSPDAGQDAKQLFRTRRWVPTGILYQLRTDTAVPEFDYVRFTVRRPAHPDARTQANLDRYASFARQRERLLLALGRADEAAAVRTWVDTVLR